jgi:hypothetical protein
LRKSKSLYIDAQGDEILRQRRYVIQKRHADLVETSNFFFIASRKPLGQKHAISRIFINKSNRRHNSDTQIELEGIAQIHWQEALENQ